MKRTLTLASMIALGAAACLPLPSMAQSGFNVVLTSAPPAPRFESVPAPRTGYVWAPGYWNWDGGRHVWLSGHWEPARNGYQYQSGQWVRDHQGYRLVQGGWQQAAGSGYGEIRIAPPPPRYERVPQGRRGHVWEPGHWEWRGNRYEWLMGNWIAERPGYVYSQAAWNQRDGRWYLEPSRWTVRGRDRDRDGIPDRMEHGYGYGYGYGDRDRDGIPDRMEHRHGDRDHDGIPDRMERRDGDHDGVPDRYDRDRDNDGVPNRRDYDRDGDGVPNEHDRAPDNARRY